MKRLNKKKAIRQKQKFQTEDYTKSEIVDYFNNLELKMEKNKQLR